LYLTGLSCEARPNEIDFGLPGYFSVSGCLCDEFFYEAFSFIWVIRRLHVTRQNPPRVVLSAATTLTLPPPSDAAPIFDPVPHRPCSLRWAGFAEAAVGGECSLHATVVLKESPTAVFDKMSTSSGRVVELDAVSIGAPVLYKTAVSSVCNPASVNHAHIVVVGG
jgi:hypothetical protein